MGRLIALLILACSAAALADDNNNEIFKDVQEDGDSIEPQAILVDDLVGNSGRAVERVQDPDAYVLSRSYVAGKDQSITIGGVYPYDRQLLSKTVFKAAKILVVNTEVLNYQGYATIHCIQIVDLQKNGQNAVATVQKGGIGQQQVSIKFKSLRGGKINYHVILWGK